MFFVALDVFGRGAWFKRFKSFKQFKSLTLLVESHDCRRARAESLLAPPDAHSALLLRSP
jgi:hypothetical protein